MCYCKLMVKHIFLLLMLRHKQQAEVCNLHSKGVLGGGLDEGTY